MAVMFASSRSSSDTTRGVLYEFKAGRSFLEPGSSENTKKVVAEKTKGLIIIKRSSDQLTHFCWKNRECNTVVDDFIIFPGDTEFKEVVECPDGRVFMLKFKSNNDRRLYWLQEADKSKGDETVEKVRELLDSPQPERTVNSGRSGGGGARDSALNIRNFGDSKGDGNELLGALDQNQLMQLLTLMNGGSASNDGASINSGGLEGFMSNEPGQSRRSDSQSVPPRNQPDLANVITSSNVIETAKANADKLTPLLPNEPPLKQDIEELKTSLTCPSFKDAVVTVGHAIKTGQAGPILEQFGFPKEGIDEANKGNLIGFAKSLSKESSNIKLNDGTTDSTISVSEDSSKNEEQDRVKEPEAKKNKPDIDNMDID
uniref:Proteasomal ubiquitin receptor ADRM1 homolog n=1 Tax=Strongyloides stercoralis TaxID=6248 RepID=A0A0K0E7M6_STRER